MMYDIFICIIIMEVEILLACTSSERIKDDQHGKSDQCAINVP